jgi:hypothetical protein
MTTPITASRAALAGAFAGASGRYWLDVYPRVCAEVRCWQARAEQIPDRDLRRLALENLRAERGNLDGAAAFAAFVPREHRGSAIRAQVAFQVIYDYLDSLAEEPSEDPVRNGRRLHRGLLVALDCGAEHVDYYAHHSRGGDGGYLEDLIDACRTAFAALPSRSVVASSALRATGRMVAYQSLTHADPRRAGALGIQPNPGVSRSAVVGGGRGDGLLAVRVRADRGGGGAGSAERGHGGRRTRVLPLDRRPARPAGQSRGPWRGPRRRSPRTGRALRLPG